MKKLRLSFRLKIFQLYVSDEVKDIIRTSEEAFFIMWTSAYQSVYWDT